jgi:hypothetical protein
MSVGLPLRETIPFPDYADRSLRAGISVAATGWAYLDALAEGNVVASSTLLPLFQQFYNAHRGSILSVFDDRAAADRVLPRSLAIDGVYGSNTRTAMAAAFAAGVRGEGVSWDASWDVMQTIPRAAGGLPSWFLFTLKPYLYDRVGRSAAATQFFQAVALFVEDDDATTASSNLSSMLNTYIAGGSGAVGPDLFRTQPTGVLDSVSAATSAIARSIESATTALLPGAGEPDSIIRLPGHITTAPSEGPIKPWMLWVAGAGALTLTGFLGFQAWKKAQRKRRRR